MGKGLVVGGGGGRAARALRVALLLVLALAAVEYIFSYVLEVSPLRTYISVPTIYSSTVKDGIRVNTQSKQIVHKLTDLQQNSTLTKKPAIQTSISLTNKTNDTATGSRAPVNTSVLHVSVENTDMGVSLAENSSVLVSKIAKIVKNATSTESPLSVTTKKYEEDYDYDVPCKFADDLGPVTVNKSEKISLEEVNKKYPEVSLGGRYSPPNCTTLHKVAIVVPFRDRQQHLTIFVNHLHFFLMKQQIEYGIFIVEQEGSNKFNRAKLMNVGFKEAQRLKDGGWKCFVFHDVDLLPLDTRNLYTCPRQPRHMSVAIDKFGFKLPYQDIFGGVSSLTFEQFTNVNGFSNKYWGWGGEDDDMSYRIKKRGYHIARYKTSVARYAMLDHKKSQPNPKRYQLLSQTSRTFFNDGLSNLKYKVIKVTEYHLYTHILVNIDENS